MDSTKFHAKSKHQPFSTSKMLPTFCLFFLCLFTLAGIAAKLHYCPEIRWFTTTTNNEKILLSSDSASNMEFLYKKRLPSAIIVGVKKAGTRALLEYMKLHPNIRAPGPEVHFFDRFYNRGLDWYR